MLNSIKIKNYQCHKNTELEFDPGVNTIVGQSDSGKSAILRALNWVITNKPSGNAYIKDGEKECSVEIIKNNDIISKKRSTTTNEYKLNGSTYKAFGQDVPEDIQKALNFNELNTQYQLDPPFLISKSNGEIAKFFNKVANLEIIDRSMKSVDSSVRNIKSELEFNKKEAERTKSELNQYKWIEEAKELYKKIEKTSILEKNHRESLKNLYNISRELEELKDYSWLSEAEGLFLYALTINNTMQDVEKKLPTLRYNTTMIEECIDGIKGLTNKIKELEQELNEIMPDICPLCNSEIKRK